MLVGGQVVLGVDDPPDQLGRHLFAGLVVYGPEVEELFLGSPVLHNLRRQFDEIAVDRRAGHAGVVSLRENAVQRVSEFVQHRADLVECQQRRGILGRFREVENQRDQRAGVLPVARRLAAEFGHPGPAAFRGPREEVHVQYGQEFPVGVVHFVGLYVRVVDRDVGVLFERDSVESAGQVENAGLHVFEFEIGLGQLFVDAVFFVFQFFGIVGKIPRHQLAGKTVRGRIFGDALYVGMRGADRPVEQFGQESVDRRGAFGHPFFEHIVGVSIVAEQAGHL